jgi:AhpD family alkylhydroperoxidase
VWRAHREIMVAGEPSRARRESVAATVSEENACPYCVGVHRTMAATEPSTSGHGDHAWVASFALRDGEVLRLAEITTEERPFFVGAAVLYAYLNRIVNAFLNPSIVPSGLRWAEAGLSWVVKNSVARREVSRRIHPREARGPTDLRFSWAARAPAIAHALSALDEAIARLCEPHVSATVRATASAALQRWEGTPVPLGSAWLRELFPGVGPDGVQAAEVAMLSARASYRLTSERIENAVDTLGQEATFALVAWGAWQSTVRASAWASSVLQ